MNQMIAIPDDLMVRVEATAQAKGKSTATIVAEALALYVDSVVDGPANAADAPPWLARFGAMAHIGADEHARIRREIEDVFEQIEPEPWQ
ncbi:MAG TPA: hypothetical protein GYA08_06945 [Chloroflexi bacterium]|nr:hypothetical protein [Chloroflexota bacterium]